MSSYTGKRVWITGASSGIGAALAEAFAGEGAQLILSGRRRDALAEVAERVQPGAHILPFEATDWPALTGAVQEAGAIDILVNNAGISQRSLAVDTRQPAETAGSGPGGDGPCRRLRTGGGVGERLSGRPAGSSQRPQRNTTNTTGPAPGPARSAFKADGD